jgi:hypothetical protein
MIIKNKPITFVIYILCFILSLVIIIGSYLTISHHARKNNVLKLSKQLVLPKDCTISDSKSYEQSEVLGSSYQAEVTYTCKDILARNAIDAVEQNTADLNFNKIYSEIETNTEYPDVQGLIKYRNQDDEYFYLSFEFRDENGNKIVAKDKDCLGKLPVQSVYVNISKN